LERLKNFKENRHEIEDYGYELVQLVNGACLGELGIVNKKTRNASAIALEDTELFVILANDFTDSFAVLIIN